MVDMHRLLESFIPENIRSGMILGIPKINQIQNSEDQTKTIFIVLSTISLYKHDQYDTLKITFKRLRFPQQAPLR